MLDEKVKKSTARDPSSPPDCRKINILKHRYQKHEETYQKNKDHLVNILIELNSKCNSHVQLQQELKLMLICFFFFFFLISLLFIEKKKKNQV
jgi:hypothetical protein